MYVKLRVLSLVKFSDFFLILLNNTFHVTIIIFTLEIRILKLMRLFLVKLIELINSISSSLKLIGTIKIISAGIITILI